MATTLSRNRAAFQRQQGDIAKTYPTLRYLFDTPTRPDVAYTTVKPTLCELVAWNCRHGKLMLFQRARVFLGFRIAMPSWTECYIGVTKDKFYFYRAIDDTSARPDFVFDLEDLLIDSVSGESEGRPFVLRVNDVRGSQLVLSCTNETEYTTWLYILRNGATAFRENATEYFYGKARNIQRIARGFLERARYKKILKRNRAAIEIQRIWRGYKQWKRYNQFLENLIIVQKTVRMHLAMRELARLKLEGNIAKYHLKRTFIFKEIVTTEENFVQDLTTAVEVYLRGLRTLLDTDLQRAKQRESTPTKSPSEDGLLSPGGHQRAGPSIGSPGRPKSENEMSSLETIEHIFNNIEEILSVHKKFLAVLQGLLNTWSEQAKIAHAFIEMMNQLGVYETYANNYDDSMALLEKMKKTNKVFREFLERVSEVPRVKKLDITGFLLAPIQRLPRYVLLLKDLLKNTWPEHPDRLDLSEALMRMQKVVSYLNDAKRKDENLRRTKSLLQKFREPAQVQEILNSPDVVCIYEGPVLAASGSRASGAMDAPLQKSWLLLFTDQLIITNRNTSKRKVVQGRSSTVVDTVRFSNPVSLPLTDVQEDAVVLDDKKQHNGFIVHTEHLTFRLFAKTEEARKKWISEINNARKNLVMWNYGINNS